MKTILYDAEPLVIAWLAQKLRGLEPEDFGECAAMGVIEDGQLIGAAVFNMWQPKLGDIHISIAGEHRRWLSKGVIQSFLAYPFTQLGCRRLTAQIARNNKRARAQVVKLGFVLEGKKRKGFGKQDCMIYGLLREEAEKWLK